MRRRSFLSNLATLPALAAFRRHEQVQSAAKRRALKLGIVTYNIGKDWDLPTLVENLTAARFEAVELRTGHRHGVEPSLPSAARAEVRKRFESSSVAIGGLGTTCEYQSPDDAILRKNIEETKQWVMLAHDIGSPSVKVRPNGLPKNVPPSEREGASVTEDKTLEQIGKALRECGAFAQDHGVKIQLEVHGQGSSRLPRIRKILDYGGNHPAVRVCWNSNQTDLLDDGFDANFRLVRDQLGQVHMRDLFLEEYPWRRLLTALGDMPFEGYCFAEIPESADPLRVLRYFRSLFLAYQNL